MVDHEPFSGTQRHSIQFGPDTVNVLVAILLQIGLVVILALGAWLTAGMTSAIYAVLGGAAAIIPNGLFAARLALHKGKSSESYPVIFFLGFFLKIGLTMALLAVVVKYLGPVDWLPFLLGLIVALKAPLFALWLAREPEPTSSSISIP